MKKKNMLYYVHIVHQLVVSTYMIYSIYGEIYLRTEK